MAEMDDLRGLSDPDLTEELDNTQRALMNLRFRSATMQLSDVHAIRKARRRIARINTIMRERELALATQ
jgi:large subunit ribosomal protein L29